MSVDLMKEMKEVAVCREAFSESWAGCAGEEEQYAKATVRMLDAKIAWLKAELARDGLLRFIEQQGELDSRAAEAHARFVQACDEADKRFAALHMNEN